MLVVTTDLSLQVLKTSISRIIFFWTFLIITITTLVWTFNTLFILPNAFKGHIGFASYCRAEWTQSTWMIVWLVNFYKYLSSSWTFCPCLSLVFQGGHTQVKTDTKSSKYIWDYFSLVLHPCVSINHFFDQKNTVACLSLGSNIFAWLVLFYAWCLLC